MLADHSWSCCRILVLGDVGLDRFTTGTVDRISPEAPVPVVHVQSSTARPGCAANVAANILTLGGSATLVGVVGCDTSADELTYCASSLGSGLELKLVADPTRMTTTKTRLFASGQQISRADLEDRHPISGDIADRVIAQFCQSLPECEVVVLSDYCKGVLTDQVITAAIAEARAANKKVLVDPKRVKLDDYRGAMIIKPNRKELAAATGLPCMSDEECRRAAEMVARTTGAQILLTRAERGMSLFSSGEEPIHQRATAREVYDVSGAGDTVIAVTALALASGLSAGEAMGLANVGAGLVVQKAGTATISFAELKRAAGGAAFIWENPRRAVRDLLRCREMWRESGFSCGFTNGCFDLLHPGHISLLKQAKQSCDRLIVAINSDESVKRLKGPRRPIQGEEARACVVSALQYVDVVTIFDDDTPLDLIAALKPDVLIKGADYAEREVVGADLVKSWGGHIVLADLAPDQSTSRTVASLSRNSNASPSPTIRRTRNNQLLES